MAQTPESSASSYLTAAEFLKRADARTVGDLCSDDGTRVAAASLPANANLAAALVDASAELESACMTGRKYSPADLAALVASSTVGRGKLYRLLTALTKVFLIERRVGVNVPDEFYEGITRAQESLKALAAGVTIFSFTEASEAGIIDNAPALPDDVTERFGTVVQAERYFGTRGDRSVNPRQRS